MSFPHRSSQQNLQHRICRLEDSLRQLCGQHDSLSQLLSLLDTMPVVKKTDHLLRQLNQDMAQATKSCHQVEQLLLQSQNNTVTSSLFRNFKSVNMSLSQLKGIIKQAEQYTMPVKIEEQKQEEANISRAASSKIEKNKKELMKMLQQVKEDIHKNSIDVTKNRNQHLTQSHQAIINALNYELGAIRCQIQFMYKDKKRRKAVVQQLQHQKLANSSSMDLQQYLLGTIEQQVYLNELSQFHQSHSKKMKRQLDTMQKRVTILTNVLQESLDVQDKQQLRLEVLLLRDMWYSVTTEIAAMRKKYIIDMRKLEQKMVQLHTFQKANKCTDSEVRRLTGRLQNLNQSIRQHVRQVSASEESTQREMERLMSLWKDVAV